MKNSFRTVIFSAVVVSLILSLFGAKFWEKKPDYTTWTEDECRDLLKDSLAIVNQLRDLVRYHFHLKMF